MNLNLNLKMLIIIIPLFLGFLVGFFNKPDKWYFNLHKSILTPPNITFGIVWSILYIALGISYYLTLKDKSFNYYIIPIIHLIINLIYTPILFRYHNILLSSIVCLLTLITGLIVLYLFNKWNNDKLAVKLLIPYIIWLVFANYLSLSLYYLN